MKIYVTQLRYKHSLRSFLSVSYPSLDAAIQHVSGPDNDNWYVNVFEAELGERVYEKAPAREPQEVEREFYAQLGVA